MTADINVILQLLQRQMAPVPPAYSAVSPSPHPPHPTTLYSTGAPTIHTVPPIQPVQIDSTASLLQVLYLFYIYLFLDAKGTNSHSFYSRPTWGLIPLSLFRVQTLTSSTNPRTPCPAGSISLWPLMTPCPCRRRLTHHIFPLWTSPLLNCQGPKRLLDCYVVASASPPCLSTWRPPQRCRRSRGMFLTRSCQAARTPITVNPGPLGRTAIFSPLCYFFFPPSKPRLSCSDAAVERGKPRLPRHWGFRVPPVSYVQTLWRPRRLLWFCAPASLHTPVQWRDYSCPAGWDSMHANKHCMCHAVVGPESYTNCIPD